MKYLDKIKDKVNMNLGFISQEQIDLEMTELLEHYGADKSQASLYNTRKILKRFINNKSNKGLGRR